MKQTQICYVCKSAAQFYINKDGYDLYACPVCEHAFVYPVPSPEALSKVYSENYFSNGGDGFGYAEYDKDKEPMRDIFVSYLSKLEKLISKKAIFDVGSATGYFLDIAKGMGWETFGNEISEFGYRECVRRGHSMSKDMDIAENTYPKYMSVVTLWDVLEHVPDPRVLIRNVSGMLSDDGILAINTIDRSSLWARIWGPKWNLIVPPEHLHYFSSKSIISLLGEGGFEIIEIRKQGKKFSLPYIFKTLAVWQGLGIWKFFMKLSSTKLLRSIAVPINLRDNVFILARKKHVNFN